MIRRTLAGMVAAAAALVFALVAAVAVDTPYQVREAQNYLESSSRTRDVATNPPVVSYNLEVCAANPNDVECQSDPARREDAWNGIRGRLQHFTFPNRYDVVLRGTVFGPKLPYTDPVTHLQSSGPFPAVVLIEGAGGNQAGYRWAAEGLAESGYIALLLDAQGDGLSDNAGTDPRWQSRYCKPADYNHWQEPQEMGIQETGSCAGQSPSSGAGDLVLQVRPIVQQKVFSGTIDIQDGYRQLRPKYIFGALDATKWLLSAQNPWRALVDGTRLAVAGHSVGAYAALMVGNGDPLKRFKAAVPWDSYGYMDQGLAPRVPTMFMQSEQENILGPYLTAPNPESLHPTRRTYAQFRSSCLDSAFLVPAASSHVDYTDGLTPPNAPPSSRYPQRVAMYYSLAWLDRYVKGAGGDGAEAIRADAERRLNAKIFDDSADRSSIGSGHWDSVSQANQPYKIAGMAVADLLSFNYSSSFSFKQCAAQQAQSAVITAAPPTLPNTAGADPRGAMAALLVLTAVAGTLRLCLHGSAIRGVTRRGT